MMISDLGIEVALVIIEPADRTNKAIWRRVGRWSRLTWVIRVVSAIIFVAVAVLLEGEIPPSNRTATATKMMADTTRITQVSRDQRPTRRQMALFVLSAGSMITRATSIPR